MSSDFQEVRGVDGSSVRDRDGRTIVEGGNPSKLLAQSYGFMAIGLIVSAAVAFLIGWVFATWIGKATILDDFESAKTAIITYFAIMIGSFVALLIDGFVLRFAFMRGKHSILPHYLIYAALMGVFLSSFVVLGVDFRLIGLAAGISAVVFLALFFVGFFSKRDFSFLAYFGLALLFGASIMSMVFIPLFIFAPGAYLQFSLMFSGIYFIVLLIATAIDGYQIRRMLSRCAEQKNVALYCGFVMYSDFIVIFIRVLYYLLLITAKRK